MAQKRPAGFESYSSGEPSTSTQPPPKRFHPHPETLSVPYYPPPPHPQHFAAPHPHPHHLQPHPPHPHPQLHPHPHLQPHPHSHPHPHPPLMEPLPHAPPQHTSPNLDPVPGDPDALFIRAPFTNFPNSHLHGPEGLTYAILAVNHDWFLDPSDFKSLTNDAPGVLTYPVQLEPPRGWCHMKKKDIKERGYDGWPDGQEPRLRCTFCRRTYAGVNAKSMWRRHVYEKHKIAMANRRDGNERAAVRGRQANKENKTRRSQSVDITGQMTLLSPGRGIDHYRTGTGDGGSMPPPAAPRIPQGEFPGPLGPGMSFEHAPLGEPAPIDTPPLTPHGSESPKLSGFPMLAGAHVLGTPRAELTSTPARAVIPESPYDPLQTPSFRHSPPKLPSDQPWRFTSPSHPLFAPKLRHQTFASMVLGKDGAPITPGPQTSPANALLFSSRDTSTTGSPSMPRSVSAMSVPRMRARATPRRLFSSESIAEPFRAKGRTIYSQSESPADHSADSSLVSDSTGGSSVWSPKVDEPSASLLDPPIHLATDDDPFVSTSGAWFTPAEVGTLRKIGRSGADLLDNDSPGFRSSTMLDQDSPVIRSRSLSSTGNFSQASTSGIGLGITGITLAGSSKLMSPFDGDDTDDEEEDGMLLYPPSNLEEDRPRPAKRRRSN